VGIFVCEDWDTIPMFHFHILILPTTAWNNEQKVSEFSFVVVSLQFFRCNQRRSKVKAGFGKLAASHPL
jgi:hypothetical protein